MLIRITIDGCMRFADAVLILFTTGLKPVDGVFEKFQKNIFRRISLLEFLPLSRAEYAVRAKFHKCVLRRLRLPLDGRWRV